VVKRPNYGQERAERQRRKAARRDERLAAKAERRHQPPDANSAAATEAPAESAADLGTLLSADPVAMARLAQVLKFVCGAEHPTTLAVRRAAISSASDDIERARALFRQLTPGNQRAALTLVAATPSALR